MAVKLTQKVLDAELARKTDKPDRLLFDSMVPGFALRIRDGRGTFVYSYRFHGRSQKVKVGDMALALEKAREIARALHADVRAGNDPASMKREERARRLTVEELLAKYLDDLESRVEAGKKRGRRSTLAEFRRTAERAIVPKLGRIEVEALDLQRVSHWHIGFANTPTSGNRAATLGAAAINFGQRRGIVAPGPNPFEQVEKFLETPKAERYTLAEVERFGRALRESTSSDGISQSFALALRLLLLCGLRRGEVLGHSAIERRTTGDGLRWGDVDLDAGVLRLRRAKAGPRVVILSSVVVDFLRSARPENPTADLPVCPGKLAGAPLVGFEKTALQLFARASVEWKGTHAFRRTFASVAGDQGFGEFIVGALLGHGAATVTGKYVIAGADPLRAAAERIAGEIAAALDGRAPASVVEFGTRRGTTT